MRFWLSGVAGCLCVLAASADNAAPPPARTKAEIDQRASELTKRQLEIADALQEQVRKNEALWLDPRFTSPEIDALRKRYENLKQEMAEIQLLLRKRVAEIPEARAELEKADRAREEYRAIGRQIEDLRKRRAQTP